jgi:hypothetical protein
VQKEKRETVKIKYVEIFLSRNLSNLNVRLKYSRIEGRGFEGE